MFISDDTVIANAEEVSAALEAIADELGCEELWGEKYAAEIFAVKDQVERLTIALRIMGKRRENDATTNQ